MQGNYNTGKNFKCFITCRFTILKFGNIFGTIQSVGIDTTHCSSPNLDLVPGAGLQSHHTAAGGVHPANLAEGVVYCLVQNLTIHVEPGLVSIPAVHIGLQTVGQSPCSRHGHSEDP